MDYISAESETDRQSDKQRKQYRCSESDRERALSVRMVLAMLTPVQREMILWRATNFRLECARRRPSARVGAYGALETVLTIALGYDLPA